MACSSAWLAMLVRFDDDLVGEATRIGNRIRGLLTGIHPALERAIGPRISHPAVLEILSRWTSGP
ncbi:transposase [Amycolatopsis decaplanina DSM 44594]|uniref:Transposase n=2 Tax=Amycolatopsis decaplanina TaxID=208441 RepID=M2XR62_9PSEU|nr:transposase [Amycolatopsis decaplanina DSM 44594]